MSSKDEWAFVIEAPLHFGKRGEITSLRFHKPTCHHAEAAVEDVHVELHSSISSFNGFRNVAGVAMGGGDICKDQLIREALPHHNQTIYTLADLPTQTLAPATLWLSICDWLLHEPRDDATLFHIDFLLLLYHILFVWSGKAFPLSFSHAPQTW